MTKRHAFIFRNALRGLAFVAALGCFQVAHAINKAGLGSFRYTVSESGKVATIKPNQGSVTGSMGSIGGSTPVGSQIGNSGWYVGASASGNPATGQTMNMGHSGDVFFSGTKYPFQAGYQVPKSAVLDALGMLCKNPALCLAAAAAGPVLSWLSKGEVSINQDPDDYPHMPFLRRDKDPFCPAPSYKPPPTGSYVDMGASYVWTSRSQGNGYCSWGYEYRHPWYPSWNPLWEGKTGAIKEEPGRLLPRSLDDIAPYMDLPDTPAKQADLAKDLLDKGADIALPSSPTVTGPATVQAGKKETVNPDGSKTTTTTNNNYKTEGNKITNTSTTTITQSCVGDGACSPATTTTDTQAPETPTENDDKTECEKDPGSLSCADLDTPDGEIPKSTFDVTYQSEDTWGSGACPAQVYGTINGKSMLLYDWAQTCGIVATYIRPLLIALCAFGALMIVAPIGGKS